MAKFGFDERALFFIEKAGMENLSGTPSDAQSGDMLMYIKSDHMYIKKPSVSEVLIVEDGVNLGSDPGDPDGAQIFVQKNSSAQLEFRTLRSSDGTINFDDTSDSDFIDITVDLSDINDELDHGVLLGLADDDHLQYLLLAGRSGGQIAHGGTDASDDLELRSTSDGERGEVKIVDGSVFRTNDRRYKSQGLETTDASDGDVTLFTLLDDKVYNCRATVLARRSDGGSEERAYIDIAVCVYRAAAGAAAIQGNVKQHQKEKSANVDADFIVSGDNLIMRVNGLAAETWQWKIDYDFVESN